MGRGGGGGKGGERREEGGGKEGVGISFFLSFLRVPSRGRSYSDFLPHHLIKTGIRYLNRKEGGETPQPPI